MALRRCNVPCKCPTNIVVPWNDYCDMRLVKCLLYAILGRTEPLDMQDFRRRFTSDQNMPRCRVYDHHFSTSMRKFLKDNNLSLDERIKLAFFTKFRIPEDFLQEISIIGTPYVKWQKLMKFVKFNNDGFALVPPGLVVYLNAPEQGRRMKDGTFGFGIPLNPSYFLPHHLIAHPNQFHPNVMLQTGHASGNPFNVNNQSQFGIINNGNAVHYQNVNGAINNAQANMSSQRQDGNPSLKLHNTSNAAPDNSRTTMDASQYTQEGIQAFLNQLFPNFNQQFPSTNSSHMQPNATQHRSHGQSVNVPRQCFPHWRPGVVHPSPPVENGNSPNVSRGPRQQLAQFNVANHAYPPERINEQPLNYSIDRANLPLEPALIRNIKQEMPNEISNGIEIQPETSLERPFLSAYHFLFALCDFLKNVNSNRSNYVLNKELKEFGERIEELIKSKMNELKQKEMDNIAVFNYIKLILEGILNKTQTFRTEKEDVTLLHDHAIVNFEKILRKFREFASGFSSFAPDIQHILEELENNLRKGIKSSDGELMAARELVIRFAEIPECFVFVKDILGME